MDAGSAKLFVRSILGILIFVLVVRLISLAVYEPRNLARPGYILKGLVMSNPPGGAPLPPEPMPDWHTALANANVDAGQRVSERCVACHDFTKTGQNPVGPDLYGVVERRRASLPGYVYSSALKATGGTWTLDALFEFLREPQVYLPGTKMSYAGVPDAQERVNLLAFMRRNSDADQPHALPGNRLQPNP
jgi:cytochrome c